MKMFQRATHCAYVGCHRPLSKHPVQHLSRWWCDNGCARRGERHLRERQEADRRKEHQVWLHGLNR